MGMPIKDTNLKAENQLYAPRVTAIRPIIIWILGEARESTLDWKSVKCPTIL